MNVDDILANDALRPLLKECYAAKEEYDKAQAIYGEANLKKSKTKKALAWAVAYHLGYEKGNTVSYTRMEGWGSSRRTRTYRFRLENVAIYIDPYTEIVSLRLIGTTINGVRKHREDVSKCEKVAE